MATRWADADMFGHVNNVKYYEYFDTGANQYLIEEGGFEPNNTSIVGFVVNSQCSYHSPILHPSKLEIGFSVNRIGNSSVEYALAVFVEGSETPSASGTFTHVFVNRENDKPTPIPDRIRMALTLALRDA